MVQYVMEGEIRLPKFQRGWVWSDEQVVRLFDSLIRGYHVGSLLIWERYQLKASTEIFGGIPVNAPAPRYSGYLLVDGQQRVASLMMAAFSGRFWFDLQEGSLVLESGPWRAPAEHFLRGHMSDFLDWPRQHAADHGLNEALVWDSWTAMADVLQRCAFSAVRLGNDWTLDRVMETFRRINTEGTKMDPSELEEALRRAQES
jgi:hypothetical protein